MAKPVVPTSDISAYHETWSHPSGLSKAELEKRHAVFFTKPSLTKQEFKNDCDINFVVKRLRQTNSLNRYIEHINSKPGQFLDITKMPNIYESSRQVNEAYELFDTLPSEIRSQFSNDPRSFFEFATKAENLPALKELGLVKDNPIGVVPTTSPAASKSSDVAAGSGA